MVPSFPDSSQPKLFKIEDREAEGSYAKNGNGIAMGEKISRLIIDDKDSRFHIAVVREKDIGFFQKIFTHIKIKDKEGDETIYVNVNSVAKRLHLSKAKVKRAAATGEFTTVISNRSKEVKRILNEYDRLFLQHKATAKMDSKLVLKVIGKAGPQLWGKVGDEKHAQLEIKKKGRTFVTLLDHEGHLNISFIRRKVGEGGLGAVYNVTTLAGDGPKELVIKYAKDNTRARDDIKREAEILSLLHGEGEVEGIQSKPHQVLSVVANGTETKEGYLGAIYAGDLTKVFKEDLSQRLKRGESLLKGLATTHEKGVVHRDIKPENILVMGDKTVISDFGSAVKPDENQKLSEWAAHTGAYTNYRLYTDAAISTEKGDYKIARSYMKQNDVFAMGVTLFQLFTQGNRWFRHFPYSFIIASDVNGYKNLYPNVPENPSSMFWDRAEEKYSMDMLIKNGVSKKLAELVTKMIIDPSKLTAKQASEQYSKILSDEVGVSERRRRF